LVVSARELFWGLPVVACEVRAWRLRARVIPDPQLRDDALHSLATKRTHAAGAALFSTLTRRRDRRLLRVLIRYEIMADFLDNASERGAAMGARKGCRLHRALVEALALGRPISSYYRHHPWRDDVGYLRAFVEVCRRGCASLPSYARVRSHAIRIATLAQVQDLNHEPDPMRRDAALAQWTEQQFPGERGLNWFELAGGASAWLGVLALLALAAEPTVQSHAGVEAYTSYFWVSLAGTMLDSFGDSELDAAEDAHSYIGHYRTQEIATERVCEHIQRAIDNVRTLCNGDRHAVLTASMVAMYLSKDDVRTAQTRAQTARLVRAGGPLARLLLPLMRLWRIANGQQSA
jgi:tetraprenyl-beta-curcumene synthase